MDISNLGFGEMIQMLGGNEETVKIHEKMVGKTISDIKLEDDKLKLSFADGLSIVVFDDGQSCCEHLYMTTDDNLQEFIGATFNEFELAEAPSIEGEYGEMHEVQFLNGKTSKGVFTLETHNEHNGYYGGFWIVIREIDA